MHVVVFLNFLLTKVELFFNKKRVIYKNISISK